MIKNTFIALLGSVLVAVAGPVPVVNVNTGGSSSSSGGVTTNAVISIVNSGQTAALTVQSNYVYGGTSDFGGYITNVSNLAYLTNASFVITNAPDTSYDGLYSFYPQITNASWGWAYCFTNSNGRVFGSIPQFSGQFSMWSSTNLVTEVYRNSSYVNPSTAPLTNWYNPDMNIAYPIIMLTRMSAVTVLTPISAASVSTPSLTVGGQTWTSLPTNSVTQQQFTLNFLQRLNLAGGMRNQKWLIMGDSMSDDGQGYDSVSFELVRQAQAIYGYWGRCNKQFGWTGIFPSPSWTKNGTQNFIDPSGGGAIRGGSNDIVRWAPSIWFPAKTYSNSLSYNYPFNGSNITSLRFWYMTWPSGGNQSFYLYGYNGTVLTNGTFSCYSATTNLVMYDLTPAIGTNTYIGNSFSGFGQGNLSFYGTNATGSNIIWGVESQNNLNGNYGIEDAWLQLSGSATSWLLSVGTNALTQWGNTLNPDVILFHCKNQYGGTNAVVNQTNDLVSLINSVKGTNNPQVVILGTFPAGNGVYGQGDNNVAFSNLCASVGWTWLDLAVDFPDPSLLFTNGYYLNDGLNMHGSTLGNYYMAMDTISRLSVYTRGQTGVSSPTTPVTPVCNLIPVPTGGYTWVQDGQIYVPQLVSGGYISYLPLAVTNSLTNLVCTFTVRSSVTNTFTFNSAKVFYVSSNGVTGYNGNFYYSFSTATNGGALVTISMTNSFPSGTAFIAPNVPIVSAGPLLFYSATAYFQ
jgi:hypothetical protein